MVVIDEVSVKEVNPLHFINAYGPIVVTDEENEREANPLQELKAYAPMEFNDDGNEMLDKFLQLKNANCSMYVMPVGIVIDFKPLQL